jgi:acyl carrier protein
VSSNAAVASDEELLRVVADIAHTQLGWHGPLTKEMRLVETLSLDSLRLLTLVVEIEDRFLICLDEQDESAIQNVGDLLATIRRKCADARPHAR